VTVTALSSALSPTWALAVFSVFVVLVLLLSDSIG